MPQHHHIAPRQQTGGIPAQGLLVPIRPAHCLQKQCSDVENSRFPAQLEEMRGLLTEREERGRCSHCEGFKCLYFLHSLPKGIPQPELPCS